MTDSPVQRLLSRLSKVRQTSGDAWIASCPGPLHEKGDRKPSLSIKETSDQKVLIHCYAGCCASEILGGIGLTLRDLFPDALESCKPLPAQQRKRYGQALEALRALTLECLIVCIAAERIAEKQAIDDEELARVHLARTRIEAAVEVAA
ncbi:MAG: DNA primase [Oceanococcus sp.]|nr:MAG: DNA primase [Oceanococcus sp.]